MALLILHRWLMGDMLYNVTGDASCIKWLLPSTFPYLLSFYYFAKLRDPFRNKPMLDSGAFSVKSLGSKIDRGAYANWLKCHDGEYSVAANLDVIGDPIGTYKNQKYMEAEGIDVLPIFHMHSPLSYLKTYIDEGYEYIGLGGLVGARSKERRAFLNNCFALGKKERIKFHGFGVGLTIAAEYPFYSIDNSNAGFTAKFGRFERNGKNEYVGHITKRTPNQPTGNYERMAYVYSLQVRHNQVRYEKGIKKNKLMYYSYFGEDLTDEICGVN